jgi:hypothetical protein
MTFVPAMLTVWGGLVVITSILYLYRSRLTRDESDQLILDESSDRTKNEQAVIMAKINRIQPVLRIFKWLVLAASVFVAGYYIRDILLNLHLI